MIFSSYPFLLAFLPATFALFLVLRRVGHRGTAIAFLLVASLVFHGSWRLHDTLVLLVSVGVNYVLGLRVAATGSRRWLAVAVAANLGLLAYYKYAAFLLGFVPGAADWRIALPLGISFFTFQQIAWHADLHGRRLAGIEGPGRYALFVTFFPQLIAGPIVHARTMLPQLGAGWLRRSLPWKLGLALLAIGLAKKVVLADAIAPGVDALFNAAAQGHALNAFEVLVAAFGYGLQLYFDFSGYADMAIGLGLLFGIRLPTNFRAPYASASIVEFWRRWHITLSRFLRDYLYLPLGGSRGGAARRSANLAVTMLLGGLWHGAGWQFVFWGGLHGAALAVNHVWSRVTPLRLPGGVARALTLTAVMLAWIPFRAESLGVAIAMYAGLLDWGAAVPLDLPGAARELAALEVRSSLPLVLPPLLALAMLGPTSLGWCLRLADWQRGFAVGALMLIVLKTLGERPDRAFLYFNF